MPPGRLAAIKGLTGMRPGIGVLGRIGAGAAGIFIIGFIGMTVSLFGFLVLVHVLYNFMMFVVTSSMLTIVVMMMLVTIYFMLFHVVYMMLGFMMMLMTSGENMFFVFVMFHGVLTFCDGFCRRVS
jgi:hypothetical protein